VRQELVQTKEHRRDEREREYLPKVVFELTHQFVPYAKIRQDLDAPRRCDRQIGAQRRICDQEKARDKRHLDVEDLAGNDSAITVDVEDRGQHGAQ